MNKVKAVIFDLDNTLLGTSILEVARQTGNRQLLDSLLPQVKLFKKTLPMLNAIHALGIPIGIVTNSPSWYTAKILQKFDIQHFFNVIVTYDEVLAAGIKPNAMGINLACERLGLSANKDEVFYIGDLQSDIDASYAAGVIPLAPTWAKTKISQMPACVVSTSELVNQLTNIKNLRLLAEAASDNENLSAAIGKKFYFTPLNMDGEVVMPGRDKLEVVTFGRYFTNKSEITAALRASHKLSKDISEKDAEQNQENYTVPTYWIDILEFVLQRIGKFVYKGKTDFDIVTVIPSKHGKPKRLEKLLSDVLSRKSLEQYESIPNLFYFLEDAQSLKTVGNSVSRDAEIERSMKLNPVYSSKVRGKRILVIDDVMTTGATLKRAKSLLEASGAERFLGVTIAKTVSSIGPQKNCPVCSRPMRVRKETFWGCSGHYEHISPCHHTEFIEVKKCPNCENKLVRKSGQYGNYLGHDWKLHGKSCNYTESIRG